MEQTNEYWRPFKHLTKKMTPVLRSFGGIIGEELVEIPKRERSSSVSKDHLPYALLILKHCIERGWSFYVQEGTDIIVINNQCAIAYRGYEVPRVLYDYREMQHLKEIFCIPRPATALRFACDYEITRFIQKLKEGHPLEDLRGDKAELAPSIDDLVRKTFQQPAPFPEQWRPKRWDDPVPNKGLICGDPIIVEKSLLEKTTWHSKYLDPLQVWLEDHHEVYDMLHYPRLARPLKKRSIKTGPVFDYYVVFSFSEKKQYDQLQKRKKLSAKKMVETFTDYQKHVRWMALKLFKDGARGRGPLRTVCNMHLSTYQTVGSDGTRPGESYWNCEDLESVIWESAWLKKELNEEAIEYAVGNYIHKKMQKAENHDQLSFISDAVLGTKSVQQIRDGWEQTTVPLDPAKIEDVDDIGQYKRNELRTQVQKKFYKIEEPEQGDDYVTLQASPAYCEQLRKQAKAKTAESEIRLWNDEESEKETFDRRITSLDRQALKEEADEYYDEKIDVDEIDKDEVDENEEQTEGLRPSVATAVILDDDQEEYHGATFGTRAVKSGPIPPSEIDEIKRRRQRLIPPLTYSIYFNTVLAQLGLLTFDLYDGSGPGSSCSHFYCLFDKEVILAFAFTLYDRTLEEAMERVALRTPALPAMQQPSPTPSHYETLGEWYDVSERLDLLNERTGIDMIEGEGKSFPLVN